MKKELLLFGDHCFGQKSRILQTIYSEDEPPTKADFDAAEFLTNGRFICLCSSFKPNQQGLTHLNFLASQK